jgi:hypothetical protein
MYQILILIPGRITVAHIMYRRNVCNYIAICVINTYLCVIFYKYIKKRGRKERRKEER